MRNSFTVSPGGRYAAMMFGSRVCVYDLPTEKCVGHLLVSEPIASCQHLSFSPDGSELLGIIHVRRPEPEKSVPRMICWSMENGTAVLDRVLEAKSLSYGDSPVDWLPQKGGWYVGANKIIDREGAVHQVPFREVGTPTKSRIISKDSALTVVFGGGSGNPTRLTIVKRPESGGP